MLKKFVCVCEKIGHHKEHWCYFWIKIVLSVEYFYFFICLAQYIVFFKLHFNLVIVCLCVSVTVRRCHVCGPANATHAPRGQMTNFRSQFFPSIM